MSISLRTYQQNAYDNIKKHRKKDNKCLLKMFCGTGKTRILFKQLLIKKHKLNIIVFPSISLVTQFNRDYIEKPEWTELMEPYHCLSVCSVDERKSTDITSGNTSTNIIYSTNKSDIKNHLIHSMNYNVIISVTYQSLPNLNDVLSTINDNIKINTLIYDEAHHIIGENIQQIVFGESELNTRTKFTIFSTATPKNDNNIIMYDANDLDNSQCGTSAYEYTHYQAVQDGYCKDFQIAIDFYTDTNIDYRNVFKAIARSIISTGNKRMLLYHAYSEADINDKTSVLDFIKSDNIEQFHDIFEEILQTEFPQKIKKYKKTKLIIKGITGKTPTKQKIKILKDFDNIDNNNIYILSSCRTIGEGIDTKSADSICFIDPKQSYTDIIQNIGRICRKPLVDTSIGTILLPVWVNKEKYENVKDDSLERDKVMREDMSESGDFNMILNVIAALRQDDPKLYNLCLNYPDRFSPNEIEQSLKKQGLTIKKTKGSLSDNLNYLFDTDQIDEFDNDDNVDDFMESVAIDNETNIVIHGQSMKNPIKTYGDYDESIHLVHNEDDDEYCPVVENKNKTTDNTHYKPPKRKPFNKFKISYSSDIEIFWKIKDGYDLTKNVCQAYIESQVKWNFHKWYEQLDKIKQFIDRNNKRPSNHSKINEEKQLAKWTTTQQQNYKKQLYIMKDKEIRQKWAEFIDKYKIYFMSNEEQWYEQLDKTKQFIDENYKRPYESSKNNEEKQLAKWIHNQTTKYKKQSNIMKDNTIRQTWAEFIDKYNKYFISNEEQWYEQLNKTTIFIEENDKRPLDCSKNTEEKQLRSWIGTQMKNYKKQSQIMKYKEIRETWADFIDKYKTYFTSNEEQWYEQLSKTKNFIDRNNKRPPNHSKKTEEKQLGNWISNQTKNYKKQSYIMKDKDIRQKWEEFVLDDEYSKYFNTDYIDKPTKPAKKSVNIKPKTEDIIKKKSSESERILSEYQELSKKMTIQKSSNTQKMFSDESIWHKYHDARDFSFEGYDEQDEIPINTIISYLETKENHKLNILDLGCGRNLIRKHFRKNKKFTITGYDHVSHNKSKVADISDLPDDDETVDIGVMSQSLMGSNWKEYIDEAVRVLRYNGELIISESIERYETITKYVEKLDLHIIEDEHSETKRWFYIKCLKR
jgi:ribosomal RNA-processing protein 8